MIFGVPFFGWMMSVVFRCCQDYELGKLKDQLQDMISSLGAENLIHSGDRVLMKPNLIAPRPVVDAVCTHPAMIRALAMIILDCGGQPYIGDSPGYASLERCLAESGTQAVVDELGIKVVSFKTRVEVSRSENRILKRFQLAGPVLEFDRIINVPKLKTHGMMGLTLAVKNLFGCIPGYDKARWHLRAGHNRQLFARILLDIYQTVKPDLHILDGVVGMEGEGPTHGQAVLFGILAASRDGIGLDYATARFIHYPENTPVSQEAINAGLLDPGKLKVLGDCLVEEIPAIKTAKGSDDAAFPFHRLIRRLLVKKPVISSSRCHRCLVCVKHCPAQAMKFIDRSVRIDYKACIRCFCCHELCPYGAVRVKWGLLR
ncbi:MAG: DUF362 domain-containing protein [Xanthomonadaceae bacterium]|nr:DUF362 domain-containing protein [Xanthomonadaceae bacterium]